MLVQEDAIHTALQYCDVACGRMLSPTTSRWFTIALQWLDLRTALHDSDMLVVRRVMCEAAGVDTHLEDADPYEVEKVRCPYYFCIFPAAHALALALALLHLSLVLSVSFAVVMPTLCWCRDDTR